MDDGGEGFEEWDADFLDQVIQVEERALSSSSSSSKPTQLHPHSTQAPSFPPPPASSLPPTPPLPPYYVPPSHSTFASLSYSPPRELSQRPRDGVDKAGSALPASVPRSGSFEKLKRELGHVPKDVNYRERGRAELRKERGQKDEQHKAVRFSDGGKLANNHNIKKISLIFESLCKRKTKTREPKDVEVPTSIDVSGSDESAKSLNSPTRSLTKIASTSKAVGVQTDEADDNGGIQMISGLHARQSLSRKLISAWGYSLDQKVGSCLLPKLFVACHSLFSCMETEVSSTIEMNSLADGTVSEFSWLCHPDSFTASEAAKMSKFHSAFIKVSSGVSRFEELLQPLLDLCHLENVNIVYRSLNVLNVILSHVFVLDGKCEKRDNVIVEGLQLGNNFADSNGHGSACGCPLSVNWNETTNAVYGSRGFRSSNSEVQLQSVICSCSSLISFEDCVSLFELMHQIIVKNSEEHVRVEAVSIMNLILLRSHAYETREKFGWPAVLESVSLLLKKESGLRVQEQALHLLFLLLNCPKILETFFFGFKDRDCACSMDDDADGKEGINFRGSDAILEGLADCISHSGNGMRDLRLQRRATMLLAFVASSGITGFEIMMNHKLSNGANFLMLVLQALISQIDMEAGDSAESPEILKERSLLMREGLILLNRLVSNSAYSAASLRMLTNSRDMASLTINVANRLSQRNNTRLYLDSVNKQVWESEVIELGRAFKRRVYAYLGDHVS